MDSGFPLVPDSDLDRMVDTYLRGGRGDVRAGQGIPVNSTNALPKLINPITARQAYHAVSFSEDGFDVQGLNLPPYLPEQNYTPPGATPSQPATPGEGNPLSAATPPPHPYHQSALPYRPCDGPGAYSQHHGYSTDSLFPKFPPQSIDIPDITFSFPTTHSSSSAAPLLTCTGQLPSSVQDSTCTPTVTNYTNIQAVHPQPVHGFPHPGSILPPRSMSNHMLQVSTVDGSQLNLHTLRNRQLAMADNKPTSNTSSPVRESDDSSSDDSLPLAQLALRQTVPAASSPTGNTATTTAPKKPKPPKRKKKKDPNEPQKPVSAYALFFRDTQAAIKGQNPNASFGEVSKIVASMWDTLDDERKQSYKKRTEDAKKDYLKQLASYRASLVSRGGLESPQEMSEDSNSPPKMLRQTVESISRTEPILSSFTMSPVQNTQPLSHISSGQPAMMVLHQQQQQQQAGSGMDAAAHMGHHGTAGMGVMQHNSQPQHSPVQYNNNMAGSPTHPSMNSSPPQVLNSAAGPHKTMPNQGYNMENQNLPSPQRESRMGNGPGMPSVCVRNGCSNPPIENPRWDREYCSNDCVVTHCRDVFTTWVAARQDPSGTYASVK